MLKEDICVFVKQAQKGDMEAINKIIKKYFPTVTLMAKKYFIVGAEYEDLVQEGILGLLKAIKYYNFKESSFDTFANLCIKTNMLSLLRRLNSKKSRLLNEAISNEINDDISSDDKIEDKFITLENPENIFLGYESIKEFKKYSENNFSELEKKVLKYMIEGYSYREIAEYLSKSNKTIDNTIQRIRKKTEKWLKI